MKQQGTETSLQHCRRENSKALMLLNARHYYQLPSSRIRDEDLVNPTPKIRLNLLVRDDYS